MLSSMAEVSLLRTIYDAGLTRTLRSLRRPLVPLLLLTASACVADDPVESVAPEPTEIASMCDQVGAIQQRVVDAGNEMSSLEVGATPEDRATILADGLDRMIAAVRDAEIPTAPTELVAGIPARRDHVVADAELEAAAFRTDWPSVATDDRRSAVQLIFVIGEKLMSEVEPRVSNATPIDLIELARDTPACRHVIQLPPPQE